MICPYNKKLTIIRDTTENEYIEDTELLKSSKQTYLEGYKYMECLKENCGAWQNGRCVCTS